MRAGLWAPNSSPHSNMLFAGPVRRVRDCPHMSSGLGMTQEYGTGLAKSPAISEGEIMTFGQILPGAEFFDGLSR